MSAFTDAIEILVERAVTASNPVNPGGFRTSVRRELRYTLQDRAREIAEAVPDITAKDLADRLDETQLSTPHPKTRPPLHTDKTLCRVCECYGGGGWLEGWRDDDGSAPILEPCPECAPERHRRHQIALRSDA